MSEMIAELGADFIGEAGSLPEMQNRLNSVCSAWNLACVPPPIRKRQLEQHRDSFLKLNPGMSPSELDEVVKVLESLIERKLERFPDNHRQIVSARIVQVGTNHRIEVASAVME
jgi:hypothetical protein